LRSSSISAQVCFYNTALINSTGILVHTMVFQFTPCQYNNPALKKLHGKITMVEERNYQNTG